MLGIQLGLGSGYVDTCAVTCDVPGIVRCRRIVREPIDSLLYMHSYITYCIIKII